MLCKFDLSLTKKLQEKRKSKIANQFSKKNGTNCKVLLKFKNKDQSSYLKNSRMNK